MIPIRLNAFDAALSSILREDGDVSSREKLRELLPVDDALEELNLGVLHKAVLGLTPIELEQLLDCLPKSALDIGDASGRTPLWWAARRGDSRTVSLLLQYGAAALRDQATLTCPLTAAILNGNQECIKQLIEISSNDRNKQGWLLIHSACQHGVDLHTFKVLLSKSPDVNTPENLGETPLMITSYRNKHKLAEWLIHQGANLNIANSEGRSSLHLAIYGNSNQTLRLLLQHQADHRAKTNAGETLVHYAAQYGE